MIPESDLFEQLAAGPKRSSELVALGLTRGRLARLVAAGKVVQLARGLYGHPDQIPGDVDSLVLVARQAPKAVVCLLSALQFHGLTTQLPREIWVALEGTSHCPKVTTVRVRFHRFTGAGFQEGIELHPASGTVLRVYDVTKTVLDCFRMRNHVGLDVAIEALRDALRHRKTTIQELDRLSRKLRIHSVVRPYLEMAASS
jgi:predicted transcriptional regulator of viral defense system